MDSEPKVASEGLESVKYPQHPIDGFQNGALLDLRVRMSINLLQSRLFEGVGAKMVSSELLQAPSYDTVARVALSIADSLLNQAAARGWVSPLPVDDGKLSAAEREHASRTGSFGVLQQIAGQRFARDEAAGVIPAAPGFQVPPNAGRH